MKIMVIKTKAHLSPGAAQKAAAELREMVKTGFVVLDGKYEYPPVAFEGDYAFAVESGGNVIVTTRADFAEVLQVEIENEFLRDNRDKLRAAIQHGLDENNRLKKEYEELDARARRYFEEKEELLRRERERNARTLAKVERALGFSLFDWQKEYIFEGKPYGAAICFARRAGKTLACCLRLCLSDGEPIFAKLNPAQIARNDFLRYLGEDGGTLERSRFFIRELRRVYETLREAGGIELREIIF